MPIPSVNGLSSVSSPLVRAKSAILAVKFRESSFGVSFRRMLVILLKGFEVSVEERLT